MGRPVAPAIFVRKLICIRPALVQKGEVRIYTVFLELSRAARNPVKTIAQASSLEPAESKTRHIPDFLLFYKRGNYRKNSPFYKENSRILFENCFLERKQPPGRAAARPNHENACFFHIIFIFIFITLLLCATWVVPRHKTIANFLPPPSQATKALWVLATGSPQAQG